MYIQGVERVQGQTLIGVEVVKAEDTVSETREEVILHFSDGSEILIFIHPEDGLHVEGD